MTRKSSGKKQHRKKNIIVAEAPKDRFVTKFLLVASRFPSNCREKLSKSDKAHVGDFFTRVARFSSAAPFSFEPMHAFTAFLVVNFPGEVLQCQCNPFRETLMHRSLRFVGACFQVVIDCSEAEDDSDWSFLPKNTASNYIASLMDYIEVLAMYGVFLRDKLCRCEAGALTGECRSLGALP
jgi:hypothetical protein